ncbi:MAG: chorismate synthase [Fretibacterium sp.]|nr:chorismate synthase [Fretibacterium sp.]
MSSEFGRNIRVSVFGQSHGRAIGVLIDGLPAGELLDEEELAAFMARRRPGKDALSTARHEADIPAFLSGVKDGRTCGSPLCAVIENKDTRSSDYDELLDKPRPGHADYTAWVKWGGLADMRGGGHFSGRLTAPLCIAGGIAAQILSRRNVHVGAHLAEVSGIPDDSFPLHPDHDLFKQIAEKAFPVLNDAAGEKMRSAILKAAEKGDSVGGVIECAAIGLPAGLGDPMFEGVESQLAHVLFGIPAVKGVEFGAGFASARKNGSQNNDSFIMDNNNVRTTTNHCGGILGGITNGMPLLLRAAVKPTPSIALPQQTVSLSRRENAELAVRGRHDPCIAPRAVPVIEAVTACVLLDMMYDRLENFNQE